MKIIKKYCACLLAGVMAGLLFTGCFGGKAPAYSTAQQAASAVQPAGEQQLRIVCTVFPVYDWMRQILGDYAENTDLVLLLDKGVDLHNYQPTTKDMVAVSACDVFVYVGGESDGWVEDALRQAANPDRVAVNLLAVLGEDVKEEEIIEGMQQEAAPEALAHAQAPEYDEHIWLSLKKAQTLTAYLAGVLAAADPANAAGYQANAQAYLETLAALDSAYAQAAAAAEQKTLLFGDRFPFRYLADDYGLTYYAAFAGCSAETEASFETITFLAGKMDTLHLGSILTLEGTQHKIAQTIVDNTASKNQTILTLDSMQSVTADDVAAGATYLAIMQKNLEVLKQALQLGE